MVDRSVLDNLSDPSQFKREDALIELRSSLTTFAGQLLVSNVKRLFELIEACLVDPAGNVQRQTLLFLRDLAPHSEDEFSPYMPAIFNRVVHLLGSHHAAVAQLSRDTLEAFVRHSSSAANVMTALLQQGFRHDNRNIRQEAVKAVRTLVQRDTGGIDAFKMMEQLTERLRDVSELVAEEARKSAALMYSTLPLAAEAVQQMTPNMQQLFFSKVQQTAGGTASVASTAPSSSTASPASAAPSARPSTTTHQTSPFARGLERPKTYAFAGARTPSPRPTGSFFSSSSPHGNTLAHPSSARPNSSYAHHTVSTSAGNFAMLGQLEFGFASPEAIAILRSKDDNAGGRRGSVGYKRRTAAIEDVNASLQRAVASDVRPHLPELVRFTSQLLHNSPSFKVLFTTVEMIGHLVTKLGSSLTPHVGALLTPVLEQLSSNEIVMRHTNQRLFEKVFKHVPPEPVVAVLIKTMRGTRNPHVREHASEILTLGLLRFPNGRFDFNLIVNTVVDAMRAEPPPEQGTSPLLETISAAFSVRGGPAMFDALERRIATTNPELMERIRSRLELPPPVLGENGVVSPYVPDVPPAQPLPAPLTPVSPITPVQDQPPQRRRPLSVATRSPPGVSAIAVVQSPDSADFALAVTTPRGTTTPQPHQYPQTARTPQPRPSRLSNARPEAPRTVSHYDSARRPAGGSPGAAVSQARASQAARPLGSYTSEPNRSPSRTSTSGSGGAATSPSYSPNPFAPNPFAPTRTLPRGDRFEIDGARSAPPPQEQVQPNSASPQQRPQQPLASQQQERMPTGTQYSNSNASVGKPRVMTNMPPSNPQDRRLAHLRTVSGMSAPPGSAGARFGRDTAAPSPSISSPGTAGNGPVRALPMGRMKSVGANPETYSDDEWDDGESMSSNGTARRRSLLLKSRPPVEGDAKSVNDKIAMWLPGTEQAVSPLHERSASANVAAQAAHSAQKPKKKGLSNKLSLLKARKRGQRAFSAQPRRPSKDSIPEMPPAGEGELPRHNPKRTTLPATTTNAAMTASLPPATQDLPYNSRFDFNPTELPPKRPLGSERPIRRRPPVKHLGDAERPGLGLGQGDEPVSAPPPRGRRRTRKRPNSLRPETGRLAGGGAGTEPATPSYLDNVESYYTATEDLQPLDKPEQEAPSIVKDLRSSDWEICFRATDKVRQLTKFNPEVVAPEIKPVLQSLLKGSENLRTQVSKNALMGLTDLMTALPEELETALTRIVPLLIKRAGDKRFLAEEAEKGLCAMVDRCSPARVVAALLQTSTHKSNPIRERAAVWLSYAIELLIGRGELPTKDTAKLIKQLAVFMNAGSNVIRQSTKRGLAVLAHKHGKQNFLRMLKAKVSASDFATMSKAIDRADLSAPPPFVPGDGARPGTSASSGSSTRSGSARPSSRSRRTRGRRRGRGASARARGHSRRSSTASSLGSVPSRPGSSAASHVDGSDELYLQGSGSGNSGPPRSASKRRQVRSKTRARSGKPSGPAGSGASVPQHLVEEMQSIFLEFRSRNWQSRLGGVSKLEAFVQQNPTAAQAKLVKITDEFLDALRDGNTKVSVAALKALQSIIGVVTDSVVSVISVLVPVLVANMGARNTSVRTLSRRALELIVDHSPNSQLLESFSNAALYGTQNLQADMIEMLADITPEAFEQKPQLIKKHVVPIVLKMMDARLSGVRAAHETLTKCVYELIGDALFEAAARARLSPTQVSKLRSLATGSG